MLLFLAIAKQDRDGDAARARIMQIIRSNPGIHTADISNKVDLAWSTVDYHLRVLKRSNVLKIVKARRECYAFPHDIEPNQQLWFATLRDPGTNRIFQRLLELPGQGVPMLSERMGLSQKVIRRQLTDLVDVGLINKRGISRPTFEPNLETIRQLPIMLLAQDLDTQQIAPPMEYV